MAVRSDHDPITLPSYATPNPRSSRPLLLVAITFYLLFNQITACLSGAKPALNGQADFRALYTAGYIVRTHQASHLYDFVFEQRTQSAVVTPRSAALPFVYPPFCSLLFVPLSLLSYRNAYFTFIAINILLALFAAALMRNYLPLLVRVWRPFPFALFLCFFPVALAFMQGQVSLVLLLLHCGTYAALQKNRPFLAGLMLSVTLIKFQIALPVAILFLVWKQWRFILGFLSGITFLTTLSASIVGPLALLGYIKSLFHIANAITSGVGNERYGMFPERMPNLHGFIAELLLKISAPLVTVILTATLSLLIFIWIARKAASLPLALLMAMLISYHMQPHDLSLMLLPLSLAAEAWILQTVSSTQTLRAFSERRLFKLFVIAGLLMLTPPIPLILIGNNLSALLVVPVFVLALWTTHPYQLKPEHK